MVAWLTCGRQRAASRCVLTTVLLVAAGIRFAPSHAADPALMRPTRIVSLNLCLEQILVELVPRDRIAAITHLGADPAVSAAARELSGLPTTRGAAEDVLGFKPDLVLAGTFTTPATVDLLRRLGQRVDVLPMPQSIAEIRDLILALGRAVGEPEAADRLLAAFDARLQVVDAARTQGHDQSIPVPDRPRPTALVYQVNSLVSGPGGLMDELLARAGYVNSAAGLPNNGRGPVPLEALIANAPDLVVLTAGPDAYATAVADNLRHPVLAAFLKTRSSVTVPWRLTLCGTHHIATAIETLAAVPRHRPTR